MVKSTSFSQGEIHSETAAIPLAIARLLELVQVSPQDASTQPNRKLGRRQLDASITIPDHQFLLEFKLHGDLATVAKGIEQLQAFHALEPQAIPLLAVGYMTAGGRKYCEESSINWLDLAGNANIKAPGLYVRVEGRENPHKQSGRPASVFAPKSSRVARWLLLHHDQDLSQRQIAESTRIDEGFTSRIVGRLEKSGLIRRNGEGKIRATDPDLLLDAWAEEYDFWKHQVYQGHMHARSSEQLLQTLTTTVDKLGWTTAATGLGAAWMLEPFAGFRIATFYVRREESNRMVQLNEQLPGFRNEPRGANLWLVEPNDEGVFEGSQVINGVPCVHPVQVWLDLKFHPERAKEAAQYLRDRMPWRKKR